MFLFHILFGIYLAKGTAEPIPPINECRPELVMRVNSDCSKFDLCINGKWTTTACNEGEFFEPNLNICVQGTGCINCENKISDPDNCRGFFICEGSRRVWTSCTETQIFDSVTGECVEMEPGEICNGPTTDSPHKKTTSSIVSTNSINTTKFTSGTTSPPSTEPPTSGTTSPPSTEPPTSGTTSPPSTEPPTSGTTSPPSTEPPTTAVYTPPPLYGSCSWGQLIPNIYNCQQYFRCNIFRQWVPEQCFFFLYFDSVSLRCVLWNPRCAGPDYY